MRIPNSIIIIKSNTNHGAVKYQPRWFARMYKEVWGKRLDPADGLLIQALPDCTPEELRYTEYNSVAQAELATVQFFSNGVMATEGNIAQMFHRNFPDGLGAEIQALLEEDAARLVAKETKLANPVVAHQSFLDAGCTESEGLSFQNRGFTTFYDVPANLVTISESVPNAAKATRLMHQIRKTADEKAAKSAGGRVRANPFPVAPSVPA